MKHITILLISIIFLSSCDQLMKVANQAAKDYQNGGSAGQLTKEQVADGLKTALKVGTENSVNLLHGANGYFADQAVKILLPKEAEDLLLKAKNNSFAKKLGLDNQIQKMQNDVILRVNRAAEDAAVEAKPIFVNAITSLNLSQAWDILKGRNPLASSNSNSSMMQGTKAIAAFDSSAATHYLKSATYSQLKIAFKPKIDNSLNKKLVGNISTNQAWTKLITLYNKVAPYIGGQKLNPSLSDYVTQKALDGLFLKVAGVEREIRRNPGVWAKKAAQAILEKVFGK